MRTGLRSATLGYYSDLPGFPIRPSGRALAWGSSWADRTGAMSLLSGVTKDSETVSLVTLAVTIRRRSLATMGLTEASRKGEREHGDDPRAEDGGLGGNGAHGADDGGWTGRFVSGCRPPSQVPGEDQRLGRRQRARQGPHQEGWQWR